MALGSRLQLLDRPPWPLCPCVSCSRPTVQGTDAAPSALEGARLQPPRADPSWALCSGSSDPGRQPRPCQDIPAWAPASQDRLLLLPTRDVSAKATTARSPLVHAQSRCQTKHGTLTVGEADREATNPENVSVKQGQPEGGEGQSRRGGRPSSCFMRPRGRATWQRGYGRKLR